MYVHVRVAESSMGIGMTGMPWKPSLWGSQGTETVVQDFHGIQKLMQVYNRNEKALGEMQTLHAGCSKVEPKIFTPLQTPFPEVQNGQNLISWRWSLPSPYRPSLVKIDECNFKLSW